MDGFESHILRRMDINQELDRIQKKGISVTIRWNRTVRFIGPAEYLPGGMKVVRPINVSTLMKVGETFNETIYRAILNLDEKHPELL